MTQAESFFNVKSVAIIGASSNPKKVGYAILKNMIDFGFEGKIYPINLHDTEILGWKCYPSVLNVEKDIDLAVFVVPAQACVNIAEECGKKGIKNIIVITAEFKEVGIEGARLEKELLDACRKHGIRALGPNCLGYIDTQNKLNASFTKLNPLPGNISLISQSGAIITSTIDWSIPEYIGFSKIISLGNKMDVNETDFLDALVNDPNTKAILMYLESIDDGKRFVEIAKKVVKTKPIVAIKSGTSDAGARAASSHTGALAGSKIAYDTAFKKCGIIQAKSLDELFEIGIALSSQPHLEKNSIVIITNAGGAGILATDAADELGLKLTAFSPDEVELFKKNLPKAASIHNPIDVIGDAGADRYKFVLDTCANIKSVSGIVVLMSPQAVTEFKETTDVLIDFNSRHLGIPLVVCYLGGVSNREWMPQLRKHGIPCFSFPNEAIRAIAGIHEYSELLEKEVEPYTQFEVDSKRVDQIFMDVLKDRRLVLLEHEAHQVTECYGIQAPKSQLARTAEEAIEFAEAMGYPVVLKISSPDILHKSDLGGIILNITTPDEVRGSFNEIMRQVRKRMPDAKIYGVTVQQMIKKKGKEIIIGANKDPQFGHLIMCGLGGIYVNFLEDVAFRLNPITRREALEMISETKSYKLLKGVRGEPPSDIQSLIDTILRISQLLTEHSIINELDINPIMVYEENAGVIILDMKITLKREVE
ncbi:MAG TPA: acetate--CoA ligase family protein [Candidatus Deferrimicrobium sp.]|nr:acetate--CoA ligase family protein [Candidatus Deferrimicrobium sp.]